MNKVLYSNLIYYGFLLSKSFKFSTSKRKVFSLLRNLIRLKPFFDLGVSLFVLVAHVKTNKKQQQKKTNNYRVVFFS